MAPANQAIVKPQTVTYERKWELGLVFESSTGSSAMSADMMRAAAAEFLGMLLFLFSVITIARFTPGDAAADFTMIALGFGLSIFVLVYILGDVSGANLNPAVSIGLLLGKRISVERFVIYVIAQVLGAIAGAGIATTFMDGTSGGFNAVAEDVEAKDAFGGEIICTFILVLTVYAATDGEMSRKHGHISALLPFAIGMAVLLDHLILIPVDGCSINPARSFATSVTNNNFHDHWVFWFGPLIGGALAPVVWEAILRPEQPVATTSAAGTSSGMVTASSV